MPKVILFPFLLMVLVGCDGDSENGGLPNIESDVSIHQGIYGQVASYPDFSPNNGPSAQEDVEIDVYFSQPNLAETNQDVPFLSVITNHKGFYEIPLQSGTYCVCVFYDCTQIEVSEDIVERLDYSSSNIGSWSNEHVECQQP